MIVDLDGAPITELSYQNPAIDVTALGDSYHHYIQPKWTSGDGVLVDMNGVPFLDKTDSVIGVTDLRIECSAHDLTRVTIEGLVMPGREYKLVAARCHLCFAPLVKEGSERERILKTGAWIERATGEYACGTTVVFEPDKKMAVTPGAKVRIGPKCVKLIKKK